MRKKLKKAAKFILEQQNGKEKKTEKRTIKKRLTGIYKIKKKIFFNPEKKSKYIIIGILLCTVLYIFAPNGLFFIAALIIVSLSRLFQRFCPFEIGIELITLFTACFTIAYGLLIGLIFGFFSMLAAMIISDEIKERWSFIALISILSVALIAGLFPYENYMSFAVFGLLLALVYDCLFDLIFRVTLGRMNIFKRVIFYVTHLYFNYFLFFYLGKKILAFLIGA
ncbi:MAG: hypothetical protein DRN66_00990 [Candidatus Nanohalarchaeota archaeon]|nr:MAG: hypothetical protein DRN66_00990 [Candidatus Nanohaloarchaeota archaeon]